LQATRANREVLVRAAGRADDWLYHVEWHAASLPQAEGIGPFGVSIADVAASVTPEVPEMAAQAHLDDFGGLSEALDEMARAYLYSALRSLGWDPRPGDREAIPSLALRLGITMDHLALFGRIFEMLGEQAILARVGDEGWVVSRTLPLVDSEAAAAGVESRFPTCRAEIGFIRRCGRALADVLRGRVDALHLLFPDGSFDDTERLYRDSPFARFYNSLVARFVSEAAGRRPTGRPLRVLEIGAGTGGTTAAVLRALPHAGTSYVFTDVSPGFLGNAARKFSSYPFVTYKAFDAECEPTGQGLPSGGFDLVIAANVLHATTDLRQALRHVQRVLAPGGFLVILEGTGRQDWIDLTFGLTSGWWRFSDRDLRPDYALLTSERWLELLNELGFEAPTVLPGEGGTGNTWPPQAVIVAALPAATKSPLPWFVFADSGGLGTEVAGLLQADGERAVLVRPASDYACDDGQVLLDPRRPEHFQRLVNEVAGNGGCRGAVHLWPLDAQPPLEDRASDLEDMQALACESALHLVQAMVRPDGEPARVCLVTRGAQTVGGATPISVLQAPIWGFGKVVALEHPDLRCVRVDLDRDAAGHPDEARLIVRELRGNARDGEVALRAGHRYVARLERGPGPGRPTARTIIRADASYLVTGGLAGLGLLVAGWLAHQGASHLVLMARSEPSAEARSAIAALEASGVRVRVVSGDVAVVDDVAAALASSPGFPPLRGVFHAAGVLDDGVVTRQDWARYAGVMRPKVTGAWNLHVLTRDLPLEMFVLFSSAAALLGSTGQSNHRRSQGRSGLSVNWGAWSEVGAAARLGVGGKTATTGMGTISPALGLAALDRLIRADVAQAAVLPVLDWIRLLGEYASGSEPPLLEDIARQARRAARMTARPGVRADLLLSINAAPPPMRRSVVQAFVRDQVHKALAIDPSEQVDPAQPLNGLGLDSLMAIELRNALGAGVKRTLPATLLFNYPTIDALSQYLCREVLRLDEDNYGKTPAPDALEALAVDEMAARLAEKLATLAGSEKDRVHE
jgi:SAM-dependent methyltransferase/acyl carrier protein